MILTRRLAAGEALVEGRLAEEMAVSRTPMREALSRLAGAGLLARQGTGTYAVERVGAAEFFQSLAVRQLLEPEAAFLAAGRAEVAEIASLRGTIADLAGVARQAEPHWDADDRVHELVAAASGNPALGRVVREMRIRTRLFEVLEPFDRVATDAQEHETILKAVEAGDGKAARRAMASHLRNLERFVLATLSGTGRRSAGH
jgi:DNA-binding GntR family transcriptional regulator